MNLVDALLDSDAGKLLEKAKKDYEVKRLSKSLGCPFVLHLEQLDNKRMTELQESAVKMDRRGKVTGTDLFALQTAVIAESINNPELADTKVLKHFKVATPREFIAKVLNAGEITNIYNEVSRLCGYDVEEEAEKVKN